MYCLNCGSQNAEAARFCARCGASMTSPHGAPPASLARSPGAPAAGEQGWVAGGPPQIAPVQWPGAPRAMLHPDPRVRGVAPFVIGPDGRRYANRKIPGVALALSFVLPGAGQFYNGDMKKGGVMLGAWLLSLLLVAFVVGVLGVLGIWIWSIIDGYRVAGAKAPVW
jgi:TM2 domain-containing membrane protein YozV